MNFNKYIRKLAKKIETMNLFVASKEINGIKIFINEIDFSKLQNTFLSYLYFYKSLYEDIYSKKVTEKVLEKELYEDAYAYYKSKKEEKPNKLKGKRRKLQAVFSKDNTIKFPNQKEVE